MTQNVLPFQYEINRIENNLTSFAGLPLYILLGNHFAAFGASINEEIETMATEENEGILDHISSFLQGGIVSRSRLGDGRKAAK
jgi:hypothetical protein